MLGVEVLHAVEGALSASVKLEKVGTMCARSTEKQKKRNGKEKVSRHRNMVSIEKASGSHYACRTLFLMKQFKLFLYSNLLVNDGAVSHTE